MPAEPRLQMIDGPDGPLELFVAGAGPMVVLVASLGRGATDFADLADRLGRAGYRTVCPQPRGIGRSTAPLAGLTMDALARDVATIITTIGGPGAQATVVGHAFGNRVARMVATSFPEVIERVVLLAAGGLVAPGAEAAANLRRVFDRALSPAEHLDAVREAFFAPGHDASVWATGWHPAVAIAQSSATTTTPVEQWWHAGTAPLLVVQPADDVIAVPANAEQLVAALDGRAELVTIPDAGHALLPEQPEAVAACVIDWLDRHASDRGGGPF
jgi:pimeloyl-ACP methyl ester carboxylesterase